jgi:hypothetical protein
MIHSIGADDEMGHAGMMKRLAPAILTVLITYAGQATAQTADPGPVQVGDRWSYDVKDAATGDIRQAITIVATEITEKEITTRISVRGKDRPRTFIYSRDWGRIDDGVWQTHPAGIGIKAPLQIGNEWRADATTKNLQNGFTGRVTSRAKVVGEEKMTTPAGTFDTFKVEVSVRLVGGADQTKQFNYTDTYWYAPAVNRWVRKTSETRSEGRLRDSVIEELTSFSRKP